MNPISPSPCLQHALRSTRRAAAGVARLEFALTVVVVGLIAALALERIAQLQVSANDALAQTTAAQTRSTAALAQARESGSPASTATMPCPVTPTPVPLAGATPGLQSPSCP